jgi:hypothetical protein
MEPIRVVPLVEPWIGLLIVLAAIALLVVGLRLLAKTGKIHPESVRKLLHIGGGLISLSLPWLFDRIWPLLVLAAIGVLALVAFNIYRRYTPKSDGLMVGVERQGEVYIGPILLSLRGPDFVRAGARQRVAVCNPARGADLCRRGRGLDRRALR